MNPAILTNSLSKRFGHTEAVQNLNLEVPADSIFALVGPNGAGKTTFIRLLMNTLRPDGGSARVLDTDSRTLGPETLARIGFVSESLQVPNSMTVAQFCSYLKPFYRTWDDDLAANLLTQLDLPPDRKIRHLSRGMRMKALIATALAFRPELLILDEPFSGLDALVRDEVVGSILEHAAESTILVSSHDLSDMESFASHIGFLDRGHLQFTDEMAALTARFREVQVTLAEPIESPPKWPDTWLTPEQTSVLVRFTDSSFDESATPEKIRALLPGTTDITVRPMPLRAIFVALARNARKAS